MVKVKLTLNHLGEIRRFKVENFEGFVSKVKLHGKTNDLEGFRMLYKDDENDWVTFSAEDEFEEASSLMKERVLNVKVSKKKISIPPRRRIHHPCHLPRPILFKHKLAKNDMIHPAKMYPFGDTHHFGVICDGCKKRSWRGRRFKCLCCRDYDLCEECYHKRKAIHQESHNFKELKGRFFSSSKKKEKEEKKVLKQPKVIVVAEEDHQKVEKMPEEEVKVIICSDENAEKKKEFAYQKQLELLTSMGFSGENMNVTLLEKHKGNMEKVINFLLNQK